jgi:hypothetical protein
MPSVAGSLSRMPTIYLAALNATGLEVDGNGTDDRTEAATKQAGKEGHVKGCCVGTGHKRDSDRKGQRGALKKNGRPTDSTGTAREVFRPAHGNRTGTETV